MVAIGREVRRLAQDPVFGHCSLREFGRGGGLPTTSPDGP